MSQQTADKVASTMIGEQIKEFDQLAASAIGELGNMICGNALQYLHGSGYVCDITPPTIIRGTNVRVDTISIPAIVIPLVLDQGEITITVGLQEHK
jgi:chemotaxis protein CheX